MRMQNFFSSFNVVAFRNGASLTWWDSSNVLSSSNHYTQHNPWLLIFFLLPISHNIPQASHSWPLFFFLQDCPDGRMFTGLGTRLRPMDTQNSCVILWIRWRIFWYVNAENRWIRILRRGPTTTTTITTVTTIPVFSFARSIIIIIIIIFLFTIMMSIGILVFQSSSSPLSFVTSRSAKKRRLRIFSLTKGKVWRYVEAERAHSAPSNWTRSSEQWWLPPKCGQSRRIPRERRNGSLHFYSCNNRRLSSYWNPTSLIVRSNVAMLSLGC